MCDAEEGESGDAEEDLDGEEAIHGRSWGPPFARDGGEDGREAHSRGVNITYSLSSDIEVDEHQATALCLPLMGSCDDQVARRELSRGEGPLHQRPPHKLVLGLHGMHGAWKVFHQLDHGLERQWPS